MYTIRDIKMSTEPRTIQGLPVHASLLDTNMTFIEEAKLPSNIGKLIPAV
jgi:hypothetical protein